MAVSPGLLIKNGLVKVQVQSSEDRGSISTSTRAAHEASMDLWLSNEQL